LKGEINVQASASSLWKFIVKLNPKLNDICCWALGDGTEVDAWRHVWIDNGVRIDEQVSHIPASLNNMKVCDLVDNFGNWNWSILQGWLPAELLQKIAAIIPPNIMNGKDIQVIPGAGTDKYSVAEMYQLLCNFKEEDMDNVWKNIWALRVTERNKHFLWIALYNC
jgi:hypothetical protein